MTFGSSLLLQGNGPGKMVTILLIKQVFTAPGKRPQQLISPEQDRLLSAGRMHRANYGFLAAMVMLLMEEEA
jgi:hypothetical protein